MFSISLSPLQIFFASSFNLSLMCFLKMSFYHFEFSHRTSLQMIISPSFQLQFMHHLKGWIHDFSSFKSIYGWP